MEKVGHVEEAETVLRDIVKTVPDNVELKLWLAQFLANNRDPQVAEATLKAFLAKQPKLYELHFGLGKLYQAMKRNEEAQAAYQKIIDLDE